MPASCGAVLCVHARRASASQIEQLRGNGRLSHVRRTYRYGAAYRYFKV